MAVAIKSERTSLFTSTKRVMKEEKSWHSDMGKQDYLPVKGPVVPEMPHS